MNSFWKGEYNNREGSDGGVVVVVVMVVSRIENRNCLFVAVDLIQPLA